MADPLAATPAAPTKKRGRWRRRIVFFLLFVVVVVVVAPFAMSLAPARKYLAERLSATAGRKVTIGGISAAWWSGIELRDVEIHNPPGYQGDPLFAVDRVKLDLALLKALTGSIEATVVVDRPVVTLIRGADGASNADGLFPRDGAREEAPRRSGAAPHVVFTLRDGKVVAHGLPVAGRAARPDVVDGITLDADVGARTTARFAALVRGAKAGGGDAPVTMEAKLDADGAGPVKVAVPPLDLARLAQAFSAFGLDAVTGSVEVAADLVFDAKGDGTGLASAKLAGLAFTRPDGRVTLRAASLEARPAPTPDGTRVDLALLLEGLQATGFSRKDAGFDEPRLTVRGAVVRNAAGDLTFGDGATPLVIEGRAVRGSLAGSMRPTSGAAGGTARGPATTEATVKLAVTLSPTLGRLLGALSSPDDDLRGAVALDATAKGDDTSLAWSAKGTVTGFVFGGGDGSTPWTEPSVGLDASGTWAGGLRKLVLAKANLTAGALALRASPNFAVTLPATAGAAMKVEGDATASVDLAAAARAFPTAFELQPGQRVAGRVEATVRGGAATGDAFDVTLTGRDLWLPGATAPGTLDGTLRVANDAGAKTLTISALTLRGMSLDVKGGAQVSTAEGGGLTQATLTLAADLGAARPLLGWLAGLPAEATLAGTATGNLESRDARPGTALTGRVTVERLRFTGARDPKTGHATTIEEARVELSPRLVLDATPGAVRIDETTLTSATLSATMKGSIVPRGDDQILDLTVGLDGDLVRVAEHLRKALGPSYDDAAGEGRLRGTVTAMGPTGHGGRDLRMAGDLTFQKLGAGGVVASDGKIVLSRPAPGTPLTATVTSVVNRGTLRVDGSCDLGKGESPWTAKVAVRGLDTSPMLTGKGAGKALTLVLPAIVPASATSSVLSGLLDADLDVRSSALSAPSLTKMLTGPGSVRMTQGQVKDSTIFGALAGGGGAGKGFDMLLKVVPGVGKTFGELSKALLFSELSSTFTLGNERITLNPVVLVSPSVTLRFSGNVGFDGSGDLDLPLQLGGSAGKAIEPYLKDRTIPLAVTMRPNQPTRVMPKLDASKLIPLPGGDLGKELEKGKDLLDDLFGKKKPK